MEIILIISFILLMITSIVITAICLGVLITDEAIKVIKNN